MKRVRVIWNGKQFQPVEPVDVLPGTACEVQVAAEQLAAPAGPTVLAELTQWAGATDAFDDLPVNLAEHHTRRKAAERGPATSEAA